jgi:subtilase family serine protease
MKFASISRAALCGLIVQASAAQAFEQMSAGILVEAEIKARGDHAIVVPASGAQLPQNIGVAAHTNVQFIMPVAGTAAAPGESLHPMTTGVGLPPYLGYPYETPASLACIHGLAPFASGCNPNVVTTVSKAGSRAIAVVDAYHYANALPDLQAYSKQFGLPVPTSSSFQVVYATGTKPASNPGWELEAALDMEMAHAMAPGATLYLVEAASASYVDLLFAVDVASKLVAKAGGGEVSMSWGGSEWSGETSYDSHFATSSVVYFASSGDSPGVSWPSSSANVVAVGGISVARDLKTLAFTRAVSWSEAGGGSSAFTPRPSYQAALASVVGSTRGVPDVAALANPETGVWVYDSGNGGWGIVGGTSVASPLQAGVTNASKSFSVSSAAELAKIYAAKQANANAFGLAASGYCGLQADYIVASTWNFCTGAGVSVSLLTQ